MKPNASPRDGGKALRLLGLAVLLFAARAFPQTADSFNPGANGWPYCLVIQPDGKIVVGGTFTTLAGTPRNYIGRLNPDGTLDGGFNPGVSNSGYTDVSALAVQPDGKILVGGSFSTLGGQSRTNLGRLNADGSVDLSFNPGADNRVFAITIQPDGGILVGGTFTNLGGQLHRCLGRLDSRGTPDPAFNANATMDPPSIASVHAFALQPDGGLLVSGAFSQIGGKSRRGLCRLDPSGIVDTAFDPQPNYSVYALALQADGRIILGGDFDTIAGQPFSHLGRLNIDGTLDTTFNPGAADYGVFSLAIQADGRILVSGGFSNLAGQGCSLIGRLNTNGTLDTTFIPTADNWVYCLALQPDGKVLAAGLFGALGGQTRGFIGRLNNTQSASQSLTFEGTNVTWLRGGTSPELWRVSFEASTNGINSFSLGNADRIAGGWQLSTAGVPLNATVRARGFVTGTVFGNSSWFVETNLGQPFILSGPASATNNAGTAASFSVTAVGTPPFGFQWLKAGQILPDGGSVSGARTASLSLSTVYGADAADYSVIVSNAFGTIVSQVARLTVIDPIVFLPPYSQAASLGQSATFYLSALGTAPLRYQWRRAGSNLAGATASALTVSNAQRVDAAGYDVIVTNAFGSATSRVALLSVNLATADSFNPSISAAGSSSAATTAVQADGRILLGGSFFGVGGQSRSNLCRLNANGTLDTNFNPGASGPVAALAVQPDGKILVGGNFTKLAGESHNNLARINSNGMPDSLFNPILAGGLIPGIRCLALQTDSHILIGGSFGAVGGFGRTNIARLAPGGTVDAFQPHANGSVYALALQPDGKILIGGSFSTLAGQSRNSLGRVNPAGTLDGAFNPGANGALYSLAVQPDGRILAGGAFTTFAGQARKYLGRLNADGTLDASFDAQASGEVLTIVLQSDGRILLGGTFNAFGVHPRYYLGRLNSDGSLDPTFNPGPNLYVNGLAVQPDGKILVWGSFSGLAGAVRYLFGRLNNTDPAFESLAFAGSDITWSRSGTMPEVWRTSFENSTNGVTWTNLGAGVRVSGGWQLGGVSARAGSAIRARGFVPGRVSDWFVESKLQVLPSILANGPGFGTGTNQFGFDLSGGAGWTVVVETSTNLRDWAPLATNTLGANPLHFADPDSALIPYRFYRVRAE